MKMYTNCETDWAQKYRPSRFEDLILPPELEQRLAPFAKSGGGMSFMFYGNPGTGKTSTALAINPDGAHHIDCSTERSIEMVRKLRDTCSTVCIFGGRRTVVLDEADSLTPEAQAALKNVIENLSVSNDFIAITNNKEGLTPALRSRLLPVCFDHSPDAAHLRRIARRLRRVLSLECRPNMPRKEIYALAQKEFPDMRGMLKRLQFESDFHELSENQSRKRSRY